MKQSKQDVASKTPEMWNKEIVTKPSKQQANKQQTSKQAGDIFVGL
jgi:hypothetical protein